LRIFNRKTEKNSCAFSIEKTQKKRYYGALMGVKAIKKLLRIFTLIAYIRELRRNALRAFRLNGAAGKPAS